MCRGVGAEVVVVEESEANFTALDAAAVAEGKEMRESPSQLTDLPDSSAHVSTTAL